MGESLFMIPFSHAFKMPYAPLLHKENSDAMNAHYYQSLKSSIPKSAGSFNDLKQLFDISDASFGIDGTTPSLRFPPQPPLLKLIWDLLGNRRKMYRRKPLPLLSVSLRWNVSCLSQINPRRYYPLIGVDLLEHLYLCMAISKACDFIQSQIIFNNSKKYYLRSSTTMW